MTKSDNASRMHKLVKQFQESGQSRKEFAAAQGIKAGKLYYWISKSAKARQAVPWPAAPERNFVPIAVTPGQKQEMRSIIIRCTSGIEIEIPV